MYRRYLIAILFVFIFTNILTAQNAPDPGCEAYTANQSQASVRSDTTGLRNIAYPEEFATYWGTPLVEPLGSVAIMNGRFPLARYMAVQVYDSQQNLLGAIADQNIQPDAGTNNPFVSGTAQGTFTVRIVFGRAPLTTPPVNTIYTNNVTNVTVLYRIYYPDNPNDLTGGSFSPVLPNYTVNNIPLTSCPPRPIVTPESSLVWGRIDTGEWVGTAGSVTAGFWMPTTVSAPWTLTVTGPHTPYFPSADNSYMTATISRQYLAPPYSYDMVVVRMHAPTFPNTQTGDAPYLALTTRQVRFWSICQDDPLTTGVNRCIEDNQAVNTNGYITIVISDPSKKPTDTTLAQFGATWMSWGALQTSDTLYDNDHNPVTDAQPTYYYGFLIYRQTLPNPSWSQSFVNIANNYPQLQWQNKMGDYWPTTGYCTVSNFASYGAGCIGK
jgi:hypothetical protein